MPHIHTYRNLQTALERERRLLAAKNGPNSAKDFLQEQEKQQASGSRNALLSPEQRVEQSRTESAAKLRSIWTRDWRSLFMSSASATDRNVERVVGEIAKKHATDTERELNLLQDASIAKLSAAAGKCNTRFTVLHERRLVCKTLVADLEPERDALLKQAESLKSLLGFFVPENRSKLIEEAQLLNQQLESLKRVKAKLTTDISNTFEGRLMEKAKRDRNVFIGKIAARDSALAAHLQPLLANYLTGTDTELETAIKAMTGISAGEKAALIEEAKQLRDGPRAKWNASSTRNVLVTTGMMLGTGTASILLALTGVGLPVVLAPMAAYTAWKAGKAAVQGASKAGALLYNTGHWTERDLHRKVAAESMMEEVRLRGQLNRNDVDRFAKLGTMPTGTQLRVFTDKKDANKFLDMGLVRVPPIPGNFALVVTRDGRHGAINLQAPHDFAFKTGPGNYFQKNMVAPDVLSTPGTQWSAADKMYFMAA